MTIKPDIKIVLTEIEKFPIYQAVTMKEPAEVLFQSLDKKAVVAYCKDNKLTFMFDEEN